MKRKFVLIAVLAVLMILMTGVVFAGKSGGTIWTVPGDFATIQEAIDSTDVAPGDTIVVGSGEFAGAYVAKSVTITGRGGAVISSGPAHSSGLLMGFRFLAGSDGAVINNLTFDGVDLAIMNGDAVDGVTVDHCRFVNTIQGVSNWRGSDWEITHNVFTDLRTRNGGGIAVLIGDFSGGTVEANVVSHNKISGTLHVWASDGGGYNGSGIVLYADFRWGGAGAAAISGSLVSHNDISIVSDAPEVVDFVGIELTDTRDDAGLDPVIFDNQIVFNDLRGCENFTDYTPDEITDVNTIDRNLGEVPNRGHGLTPAAY